MRSMRRYASEEYVNNNKHTHDNKDILDAITGIATVNDGVISGNDTDIVNKAVINNLNSKISTKISSPLTAEVGNLIKVEEVDENNKPISFNTMTMPMALKNPYAITFTGAVTGTYDGSAALI